MIETASHVFALPDHLHAKTDPALIAADEAHLTRVAATLEQQVADLTERLTALRRAPGGTGRGAMDRDLEIHRLTANLRVLRRYGLDVCLGRMVPEQEGAVYVGRLGLTDETGQRLLVDWRAPAAEPFFAATHANPMGLTSRRRYRWTRGRITDYWDEVFAPEGWAGHAALDDQSAFIASLGSSRTTQMRDVLATIQADQDAIIRADSRGTLVVDGGPGTGKTVVALHRTAYLLYADPRLGHRRGGVLFVGPHPAYLAYVADVLPSLGEEGVQTCTLRDLIAEGRDAPLEPDPDVAVLKASLALVAAIEPAVALHEEPPTTGLLVETDWSEVWLSPTDWAEAFAAPDPGTPHNEARDQVLDALIDIVVDGHATRDDDERDEDDDDDDDDDDDEDAVSPEALRRSLRQHEDLVGALDRAWPMIEADDLVGDLWSVPAYLRRCAPGLTTAEVAVLQRADAQRWTRSDLPLLDAARHRLGDAQAATRARRREAVEAADRAYMDRVVEDLIQADDDPEGSTQLLRRASIRDALVDGAALPTVDPDLLAGPFAHVVVDEAQELTDAEWQMLLRRCPSRSLTVVGDRAQARHGFAESWAERLTRIGCDTVALAPLTVNYRTPAEIMAEAEPVIRSVFPDANVPTSVRSTGVPVTYGSTEDLAAILHEWLQHHEDGIACLLGDPAPVATIADPRVRSLTPENAKGLEFDLVVLVDPDRLGSRVAATVDRYVAMTRATQRLVVLTGG